MLEALQDEGHIFRRKSGDMKISAPRALALSVAVGHALAAVTKGVSDNTSAWVCLLRRHILLLGNMLEALQDEGHILKMIVPR
jgi:hypothetical protein